MNLLHSLPLFLAQTADDAVTTMPQQQINPVVMTIFAVIYLGIILLSLVGMWKVFTKAGWPGWASIVPIYNLYALCKISSKPAWLLWLLLIPIVNVVVILVLFILISLGMAQNFGKSGGFAVGLFLLPFIFYPILGFDKSRYLGHAGAGTLPGSTAPYPAV